MAKPKRLSIEQRNAAAIAREPETLDAADEAGERLLNSMRQRAKRLPPRSRRPTRRRGAAASTSPRTTCRTLAPPTSWTSTTGPDLRAASAYGPLGPSQSSQPSTLKTARQCARASENPDRRHTSRSSSSSPTKSPWRRRRRHAARPLGRRGRPIPERLLQLRAALAVPPGRTPRRPDRATGAAAATAQAGPPMTGGGERSIVEDALTLILLDPDQPNPATEPPHRADLFEIPDELLSNAKAPHLLVWGLCIRAGHQRRHGVHYVHYVHCGTGGGPRSVLGERAAGWGWWRLAAGPPWGAGSGDLDALSWEVQARLAVLDRWSPTSSRRGRRLPCIAGNFLGPHRLPGLSPTARPYGVPHHRQRIPRSLSAPPQRGSHRARSTP